MEDFTGALQVSCSNNKQKNQLKSQNLNLSLMKQVEFLHKHI